MGVSLSIFTENIGISGGSISTGATAGRLCCDRRTTIIVQIGMATMIISKKKNMAV
jgi:hypothetical protein